MTKEEYWSMPWYKRLTTKEPLPEQPAPQELRIHLLDGSTHDIPVYAHWVFLPGNARIGRWEFDLANRGREAAMKGFWHDGFFYPGNQVKMVENLNRRT